jgi:hypothetical protein
VGKLYQSIAIVGKLYQSIAIVGKLYQSIAIVGKLYQSIAIVGKLYQSIAIVGKLCAMRDIRHERQKFFNCLQSHDSTKAQRGYESLKQSVTKHSKA